MKTPNLKDVFVKMVSFVNIRSFGHVHASVLSYSQYSFTHLLIIKKSITSTEPVDTERVVTYMVPKYTYRTSHNTKFIFTYFKK
jgi:hypothetical protein